MNTLFNDTNGYKTITDDDRIVDCVLKSLLEFNNTFCPNIKRTIFNLGKNKEGKHTLATTVFWADDTKTTVVNSEHDSISTEETTIKLSDGSEVKVETATKESKEIGLVYAIVKRMVGGIDEKGTVGKGFCTFLRKQIANSHDQNYEDTKTAKENAIRKAKFKNSVQKPKEKPPSLRNIVKDLAEVVSSLKEKIK